MVAAFLSILAEMPDFVCIGSNGTSIEGVMYTDNCRPEGRSNNYGYT